MTMKTSLITAALLAACGLAFAKIPPPTLDDAAKAKAAEAAAKTAWQAKIDAWQLCRAQDRVAAFYAKSSGKAVPVKTAAAPAAKPSPTAAVSSPPPANPPSTPTGVATSSVPPPCLDPGPFAYTPPAEKPLETSGAHSPAGTAVSPPSVNKPSGEMTDGKTGKKS